MSLAHVSTLFQTDSTASLAVPQLKPIVPSRNKTNYRGQIRPVSIWLEEIMYTGRVPVSTWTLALALTQKLWVSDRLSLSFGKRMILQRQIYQDKIYVPDRRLDLNLSVTAYNSYGDIIQANKTLRGYLQAPKPGYLELLSVEQDWMQLLLKFRVKIG